MQSYRRFLEIDGWGDENSLVEIVSAPLANTVSWRGGTEKGPEAILEASDTLELFDEELLQDTFRIGIMTQPPLELAGCSSEKACRRIGSAIAGVLSRGHFPVLLGGEHTVSLPAILACRDVYPDLHVVQIDAHLDLRESYGDDMLSHACVMRRVHEAGIPFCQIGIRSISREEWQFVKQQGLRPWTMALIRKVPAWIDEVVGAIDGPVYLTIDVDGLDASVMPATGTPEPAGLDWWQLTALIAAIAARHPVVGLDCVEFSPLPGAHHAAYTAAKLLYRSLGYIFKDKLPDGAVA